MAVNGHVVNVLSRRCGGCIDEKAGLAFKVANHDHELHLHRQQYRFFKI